MLPKIVTSKIAVTAYMTTQIKTKRKVIDFKRKFGKTISRHS